MELNKCFFSGYAVSGLKMQNLPNGGFVGEFSIGINDPVYTKADGTKTDEHCNFVKIAVFGNYAASLSKMITKGTPVIVGCRLRQNSWEKDGVKHYDTSFIADFVKVLHKGEKKNEQSGEFFDSNEGAYMPGDFVPQTSNPPNYEQGIW